MEVRRLPKGRLGEETALRMVGQHGFQLIAAGLGTKTHRSYELSKVIHHVRESGIARRVSCLETDGGK